MAFFIKKPITFPWIFGIGFRRNGIISILSLNIIQNLACSIGFICQNRAVRNINTRQQINSDAGIMDISACQKETERISKSIYNCMNFSGFTPTASANKLIIFAIYSPFLAPALWGCALITVESKDRFSMSAS